MAHNNITENANSNNPTSITIFTHGYGGSYADWVYPMTASESDDAYLTDKVTEDEIVCLAYCDSLNGVSCKTSALFIYSYSEGKVTKSWEIDKPSYKEFVKMSNLTVFFYNYSETWLFKGDDVQVVSGEVLQVGDYGTVRLEHDESWDYEWCEYFEFGASEDEGIAITYNDGTKVKPDHFVNLENSNGEIVFFYRSQNYIFNEKTKEVSVSDGRGEIKVIDSGVYNNNSYVYSYYSYDLRWKENDGNYFVNIDGKEIALGTLAADSSSVEAKSKPKISYVKDVKGLDISHGSKRFRYDLSEEKLIDGGILPENQSIVRLITTFTPIQTIGILCIPNAKQFFTL